MFIWFIRQTILTFIILIALISGIILLPRTATCQCLVYAAFVQDGNSRHELILYDIPTGLQYPLMSYANLRDISTHPNGETLFLVQNRPNRLLSFNIYTGQIGRILNGFVEYPIVSYDGEQLAYILDASFGTDITSDTGIHLMNIERSIYRHLSMLTNTTIAWYPDNQHLTTSLWNEEQEINELWLIDIETGEREILFSQEAAIAWHQWHPTDNILAYYSEDWVYIYNLDTQTLFPLSDNSRRPVWSFDGTFLAYIEQIELSGTATINIATGNGDIIRRIPYLGDGFVTRVNWWQPR